MSEKSIETKVFEWLNEIQDANPLDLLLNEADIQDSNAQEMTKDLGVYVSSSEWDWSPGSDGVTEFDGFLVLAIYSRVRGTDKSERLESRDKSFALAKKISVYLYADNTLGERFCDSQQFRAYSGNTAIKSDKYSVINLPIVLNPTGELKDFSINRPV